MEAAIRRAQGLCDTGRKPVIVRTDSEQQLPQMVEALQSIARVVELPEHGTTEQDVVEACKDAVVILHCYTPITRQVIEGSPRLRGIVKYGVGIDAIDIDAAKERGIGVANVPEYGEETVAEGAFCLMITLMKKVKSIQRAMERSGWVWPEEEWLGVDLAGKSLCVVGFGRIGRSMVRMARGFRMQVYVYDPYVSDETLREASVARVTSVMELCRLADVLSIHAVLNDETKGIITEECIEALKPSAIVVNVSRGEIIDERALVRAVIAERVGGVGLDVFGTEPITPVGHLMSPLLNRDNCILTPHLAFWTREARDRLQVEAVERCVEVLLGEPLRVLSRDPRLTSQTDAVVLGGYSSASGRMVSIT